MSIFSSLVGLLSDWLISYINIYHLFAYSKYIISFSHWVSWSFVFGEMWHFQIWKWKNLVEAPRQMFTTHKIVDPYPYLSSYQLIPERWSFFPFRVSLLFKKGLMLKSPRRYVMRCAIWYHLYNLKNVKKTRRGVLLLVKLQTETWRMKNVENKIFNFSAMHSSCVEPQILPNITNSNYRRFYFYFIGFCLILFLFHLCSKWFLYGRVYIWRSLNWPRI